MGVASPDEITAMRKRSINTILKRKNLQRQKQWTESIAVGSESVVDTVKDKLGIRAKTRTVHPGNDNYQLREVAIDPVGVEEIDDRVSGLRCFVTFWQMDLQDTILREDVRMHHSVDSKRDRIAV